MLKTLTVLFLTLSVVATGGAGAATKDLRNAVFSTVPLGLASPNAEQRLAFAEAIQKYWENFNARVPRLSPSDREWIEAEMGAQGDRVERALKSEEYAIWSLNAHVDVCLSTVGQVINSFETEQTKQTEMFFWLQLINCYNGSDDVRIYLHRAGIPYNDDSDQHVQTPDRSLTQTIIVNQVAPAAMVETMDWSSRN
ncbi:hypothetical protein [Pseudophaeobacter sp. EL27]|uniref:hypothetical protein n=1 Tax=Pseudophaeobacter sp. EL27 TaxID=2107580 RepID=UPI000EFB697A|nr:hypothetical protein [Pseudophaeobacter sp. EL27]